MARSRRLFTLAVGLSIAASAASATSVSAEGGYRTGQEDQITYKIVPYVIADPSLVANPQVILDEFTKHGDLSGLGISPADGGPSKIAGHTVAAEPRSYVVDSSRFPGGSIPDDRYDYAKFDECNATGSEAYNDEGLIKNRYSYCQVHLLAMPAYECGLFPPRCQLVGTFLSLNTMIG